jgi:hypothetical protein
VRVIRGALPTLVVGIVACTSEPSRESSPPSDTTWAVTPFGYGPLRAGMTITQARAAVPGRLAEPTMSEGSEGCGHATLTGEPRGVVAMIVDGKVARVEVRDAAVLTDKGARVGDSEARIKSLYAGQVTTEPHKYTDGHYLVVRPTEPADSAYRLIFETDGKAVIEYRAGTMPQVGWVEGCS